MRDRSGSSCNISPTLARQTAGTSSQRGKNRLRGPMTLLRALITLGLLQRALPSNCRAVSPFLSDSPRLLEAPAPEFRGRKMTCGGGFYSIVLGLKALEPWNYNLEGKKLILSHLTLMTPHKG
ncbi:uncharacterized protein LOC143663112 isoform X2 [Tamandua tetradactyla]|uniref:uncharacterized protein LOC143663112 isoform X2 n=1 Tax=Tamandua tetradactyla TaxID=48850 RepID=UPI004053CB9E